MKCFPVVLVFALLVIVLPVNAADFTADSPLPPAGPVDDITTDFENLPAYFGLGAVVSLLIMVIRRLGLPDGWGGYANLAVGIFAFAAVKALGADSSKLFEILREGAELLILVFGGQAFHAGAKYAGLGQLWKGKE